MDTFLPGIVKCQWKTIAGTAHSPEDYTETTGAVQFASGSRSSIINITIVDDNIPELSKTFEVELFNAEGGGKSFKFMLTCFRIFRRCRRLFSIAMVKLEIVNYWARLHS